MPSLKVGFIKQVSNITVASGTKISLFTGSGSGMPVPSKKL